MSRPRSLLVVVGTATDVGKTWATSRIAGRGLAQGLRVAARKPVQSFDERDARSETDAHLLAAATGERVEEVTPRHRWYERPVAPPMAAELLGRPPIALDDLVGELRWPAGTDLGLLETAGGLRSPMAVDGDGLALARRLRPDLVLLVADAGLGAIGAVRLAADALAPLRTTVLLNRFRPDDDLHARNLRWLRERDGYDVVAAVDEITW